MKRALRVYDPESVDQIIEFSGTMLHHKPPIAIFRQSSLKLTGGRNVHLYLSVAAVRKFNLSNFRFCDLAWSPDTMEIIVRLKKDRGHRKIWKTGHRLGIATSHFLAEMIEKGFPVPFDIGKKYPVSSDGTTLYIDLSEEGE